MDAGVLTSGAAAAVIVGLVEAVKMLTKKVTSEKDESSTDIALMKADVNDIKTEQRRVSETLNEVALTLERMTVVLDRCVILLDSVDRRRG